MSLKFEWIGENSAFECLCNKAGFSYKLIHSGIILLNE
ncbi:hypothetical protein J559_2937 [Acinetobacter sp. 983759]|nr:hypothetical protein J520_2959 [Acinetobacter sp. 869535]EXE12821.1 hypothetical protein J559_2937 [Acinetobacter sp. 983759]